MHCANLVLVPVTPIMGVVLVAVIQFFFCALLDNRVLSVMLVIHPTLNSKPSASYRISNPCFGSKIIVSLVLVPVISFLFCAL